MADRAEGPPELAGLTFERTIGSGGFADVFLYRQHFPSRPVAVKVLRHEHVAPETIRQFEIEANVMGQISEHQFIVAIYAAGVAPDGRPYIVMEYYPGEHFGLRARGGRLQVALVLEVAVQISSAVATAHAAGILHRDIKPANILTSRSAKPGLTDFGISGTHLDGVGSETAGYTLQYAPPEVLLDENRDGTRADIYSMAATTYALLDGRPPYFQHGGNNDDDAVFARIAAGQLPPLDRSDIPESLQHLLANAMSLDPATRPPSALAFAQALQSIEQELRLAPTPIEVLQARDSVVDWVPEPSGPATQAARRASSATVDPTRGPSERGGPSDLTVDRSRAAPSTPAPPPTDAELTQLRRSPEPSRTTTDRSQEAFAPAPDAAIAVDGPADQAENSAALRGRSWAVLAALAVAVAILGVLAVVRGGGGQDRGDIVVTTTVDDLVATYLPSPDEVVIARPAEGLSVTWAPPPGADEVADLSYRVHFSVRRPDGTFVDAAEAGSGELPSYDDFPEGSVALPASVLPSDGVVCVRIETVADGVTTGFDQAPRVCEDDPAPAPTP